MVALAIATPAMASPYAFYGNYLYPTYQYQPYDFYKPAYKPIKKITVKSDETSLEDLYEKAEPLLEKAHGVAKSILPKSGPIVDDKNNFRSKYGKFDSELTSDSTTGI